MRTYYGITLILTLCICNSIPSYAQKTGNVGGRYSYFVDENANVTFSEARIKAIENARVEALKETFGTMISSDIVTEVVNDSEGGSHSELRELAQETSRGEWLADTAEPQVEISYDKNLHSFKYDVTISGKARRITKSKTIFHWNVLGDGVPDKKECDSFNSGDRIYVSFKSPVNGYLAIYLLGDDGTVSCLLPYPGDESGVKMVVAGEQYVFFDKEKDPKAFRYRLKTDRKIENNVVYLIFSKNPFTKCIDEKSDPSKPNTLSVTAFENWKFRNMQHDDEMTAEKKWVKIFNNLK